MEDLAKQIEELRLTLGEVAYNAARTLQGLDTALVENDNHLLNFAHGMFERHRQRQQQLIAMLIGEAQRLMPPTSAPVGPDGVEMEGGYPRFLQGQGAPAATQGGRAN